MSKDRKRLLRPSNVIESLSEKLPFYPERNKIFDNGKHLNPEEIEKFINISLSGNHENTHNAKSANFQIPTQPCQTTINLYINDPHILEKSWDKYRKTPPRRKMRNEIVLGKNIPDHTLMKNLLGDLGVKKFSSAPNMTNKYLNSRRRIIPSERFSSEQSFTDSFEGLPSEVTFRNLEMTNPEKGTELLYVNERKSGGDFSMNRIERISEEEEDKEVVEEKINSCPVHCLDHSVVKVHEDSKVIEEGKPNLKDPLKRFKRKPFRASQVSKNPAILYRDIIALKPVQHDQLEQPRRTLPSFHVRTKMVKDILGTTTELLHSYQSGLMRNHKRLFDSLRHKNFQDVVDENRSTEGKELLPKINASGKIDEINVKQSKLILCGKNRRPICSVESHGSYEEYKKKLVEAPDGTLCCRNIDYGDENEDTWSRAETRNMITSEFVKNKVKKFDTLLNKNSNDQHDMQRKNKMGSNYEKGRINEYQIAKFPFHDTLSHNILNGESISFPRETKNAMTRLISKRSKVHVMSDSNNEEEVEKKFATLREIQENSIHKKNSSGSSTSYEDASKLSRCWPGVAERVLRSTAEENTP